METESHKKSAPLKDVKTSKHASRYLIIGIAIAAFNYALFMLLSNVIINNNDFLWLFTLISTLITTVLAYILHSKITWKERPITKSAKYKFLIWNLLLAFAIGPILTQLFSLITPLYEFAFQIIEAIHLPFSYEFTLTTGTFILTAIITTLLNFFFYDKFVFGKAKEPKKQEESK